MRQKSHLQPAVLECASTCPWAFIVVSWLRNFCLISAIPSIVVHMCASRLVSGLVSTVDYEALRAKPDGGEPNSSQRVRRHSSQFMHAQNIGTVSPAELSLFVVCRSRQHSRQARSVNRRGSLGGEIGPSITMLLCSEMDLLCNVTMSPT
jgi:hypothetical protein